MDDSRLGQEMYKMGLKHLDVPNNKENCQWPYVDPDSSKNKKTVRKNKKYEISGDWNID